MRLLRPAGELRRASTPDRHRRLRGQSLVEFAIVLPILLLLTLVALDFGRVYLGWINLQSMSRIAANLAANNPTAWQGGGDAAVKAKYQNQIRSDAAATNCQLPVVAGVRTAPAPVFVDSNGNGATDDLGDSASVSLSCTFDLITPGIKNLVGNNLTVSASTVFPVSAGMTSAMGGGPVGSAPNAAFTGNGTLAPSTLSGTVPVHRHLPRYVRRQPDELAVDLPRRRHHVDAPGSARSHVHVTGHLCRDDASDEFARHLDRVDGNHRGQPRRRSISTTPCPVRMPHRSRHSRTTRPRAARRTYGTSDPARAHRPSRTQPTPTALPGPTA